MCLPDISISVNHTGPMKVDEGYELQCDIHTVADVVVRMYKGHHQVNETIFTFDTSDRNPYKVQIHPNKNDDGAQYWCEAEQKLVEQSQRPIVTSKPLSITVHCKNNNFSTHVFKHSSLFSRYYIGLNY